MKFVRIHGHMDVK